VAVGVNDLDCIVVSDRNQNELSILAQFDAARSLTDLDCFYDREFIDINYADGIALFVRNIRKKGVGLGIHEGKQAD
jgi:hypothetical protein